MRLLLRWRQDEVSLHEIREQRPGSVDGQSPSAEISLANIKLDFQLSPLSMTTESERLRLVEALQALGRSHPVPELSVRLEIPVTWGVKLRLPPMKMPPEELAAHLKWELSNAILDPVDQYRYNYIVGEDGSIRLVAIRSRLQDLILQTVAEAGYKLRSLHPDEPDFSQIDFLETSAPHPEEPAELADALLTESEQHAKNKPRPERRKAARGQPSWFFGIVLIVGIVIVALWGWMKLTSEKRPGRLQERTAETNQIQTESQSSDSRTATDTSVTPETPGRAPEVTAKERPVEQLAAATSLPAKGDMLLVNCLTVVQVLLGDDSPPTPLEMMSFTGDRFLLQMAADPNADPNVLCGRLKAVSGVLDVSVSSKERGSTDSGVNIGGRFRKDAAVQETRQPNAAQISAVAKRSGMSQPSPHGLVFTGDRGQVVSFLGDLTAQRAALYRLILVPWSGDQYRVVVEL